MEIKIWLTKEYLLTLYKLASYDVAVPKALRRAKAGEPFIAEVEEMFDTIRKTTDRANESLKAQFGVPLF